MDRITLADINAARDRIAGRVRRTPLAAPAPFREDPAPGARLTFKLECLQVTGSFKARGATSKLLSLDGASVARGLVTASGGNHGLGVAYAGWQAGVPVRIFLPESTPAAKAEKLRAWGADVRRAGAVWDDANVAALEAAERDGLAYVHPFADPAVIAGQGTVALEILEDAPETGTILVAVGGGGLISGIATAAKALKPGIRVVGIEPAGAPTLYESLRAGRPVRLDRIETRAGTLAPRESAEINLAIIRETVDDIVLVGDEEMAAAARWLWFEMGLAVELGAAAAVAALAEGRIPLREGEEICAVVCGAGTDGLA